jgi:CheY-like chemotaxis protein
MNILIVDDKMENLYMLEMILKSGGHTSVSAQNGAEALKKLKTERVDLIISDILMPEMDGYHFCLEVRRDHSLRALPFIFLTASYTEKKDEELALKMGADRFMVRPIEPAELLNAVDEVFSEVKGRGASQEVAAPAEDKDTYLLYNSRLVNKLEQKNQELEQEIAERRSRETGIMERVTGLADHYRLLAGRDGRVLDIEKEINSLMKELKWEKK